ncbi:MAG: sialidase family protein [Pirellulaceae bacterium]|nr:sialidase family protein [Pirellulaceae bacterium]
MVHFSQLVTAIVFVVTFLRILPCAIVAESAAPAIEIHEVKVISWKSPLYHGWPTLARRANGELLLAFSGGREKHVCPFGRLEWMRSSDNGKTWGWPQVLYDSPIDDRDAGVLETPSGTILVTTFTSLAYQAVLERAEQAAPGQPGAFADTKLLAEWQAAHGRIDGEARNAELGTYMLRSIDGGVTWSARYSVPINSPHGPISLGDGRLLYAGKALRGDGRIGVCDSNDDGVTWNWLATIPTRDGDREQEYHELHAVECTDGTIVCHIRNENKQDARETLQTESKDGGKTWTVPHRIGVWGLPSHLVRLKNGNLLMTYGLRRAPIGILARVSSDNGVTWSQPSAITTDGTSGDLGYPSTVECDDGTLVTVWYERMASSPLAQLRQAHWSFK